MKLGSLALMCIVCYIVFLIGYSVYLYFSPNTARPTVGLYWYQFLADLVGIGPQSFSVASSKSAVGNDTLGKISNVHTPNTCMSNCNITKDCIGFVYDSYANTCTTFTTAPGLMPATPYSNVYYITGNEPSNVYTISIGKNITTPSSILAYVSTNIPFDCAANCAVNSKCTGFAINTTTGLCNQSDSVTMTSNLAAVAGTDTYILKPVTLTVLGAPYADAGILP